MRIHPPGRPWRRRVAGWILRHSNDGCGESGRGVRGCAILHRPSGFNCLRSAQSPHIGGPGPGGGVDKIAIRSYLELSSLNLFVPGTSTRNGPYLQAKEELLNQLNSCVPTQSSRSHDKLVLVA